uniref:Uncharacterized protein n=1 Tax=Myotis myotis TaxID=51298 RepID=A0A7J7VIB0_MYOMY|nr:hypothetical protein mMyoMyo1_008313 [Myotis myotis]
MDRPCLCSAKHAWTFSSLNDGGFTNISGGGSAGSCFANWCSHQSLRCLAHVPQTNPGQGVPTSKDRREDQKPFFSKGPSRCPLSWGHLPPGDGEAQRNPGIYLKSHSKTALRLGVGTEESLRREQQIRLRPWLRLGGDGDQGILTEASALWPPITVWP